MDQNADAIAQAIKGSLKVIEQDREREIISRRFGLNGQKETLEQIGDMLSITRERVRQLEKAILIRLRVCSEEGNIAELAAAEKIILLKWAALLAYPPLPTKFMAKRLPLPNAPVLLSLEIFLPASLLLMKTINILVLLVLPNTVTLPS